MICKENLPFLEALSARITSATRFGKPNEERHYDE
jgi:hypothetical protein